MELDEFGSGLYLMMVFGINSVELSNSITRVLIYVSKEMLVWILLH